MSRWRLGMEQLPLKFKIISIIALIILLFALTSVKYTQITMKNIGLPPSAVMELKALNP